MVDSESSSVESDCESDASGTEGATVAAVVQKTRRELVSEIASLPVTTSPQGATNGLGAKS